MVSMLPMRCSAMPIVPSSKQLKLCSVQPSAWCPTEFSSRRGRSCKVSKQLVQLETAVLADMPTEQVIHLLKKHGVDIQTVVEGSISAPKQLQQQEMHQKDSQQLHGEQQQQQQDDQQQQQDDQLQQQQQQQQRQKLLPRQTHQRAQQQQQLSRSIHEQQQSQLSSHMSSRSTHVAAAAAKRSMLLSQLAAARVAARAKIVRLPLRLTIAGRAGSRRYLTVPVDVYGVGFVDFLLDSSTFYSRITPSFRNRLGLGPADGVPVITGQKNQTQVAAAAAAAAAADSDSKQGTAPDASSSTSSTNVSNNNNNSSSSSSSNSSSSSSRRLRMRQRVQLPDLWIGTAQLPRLQAYVSPLLLLPSRRQVSSSKSVFTAAPSASAIAGSLGVQVLRHFELDVDVAGNQLAVHPAGHVELGLCDVTGMTPVPCRYTKSGAIVLPVSLAGSAPFTGLLDLSAATSIMNWEAAALLGMTCVDNQQETQQQPHMGIQDGSKQTDNNSGISTSARGVGNNMYGYFGSIEIVPDEMLPKPIFPHARNHKDTNINNHQLQGPLYPPPSSLHKPNLDKVASDSQGGSDAGVKILYDLGQTKPSKGARDNVNGTANNNDDKGSIDNNTLSGTHEGYLTTPLRIQRHQVASSQLKLVLGARLSLAVGGFDDQAGSIHVPAPPRIGVAALKGLSALGISGQPAMVIGADVWARSRAVLCLKAGKLFMQCRMGHGMVL